ATGVLRLAWRRWKWRGYRASFGRPLPFPPCASESAAKMPQRHKARQYALQMLFQWEIGRQEPRRIEEGFWRIARAEKNTRAFANDLFEGVVKNALELDAVVTAHIEN